jgi:hypothetical protein
VDHLRFARAGARLALHGGGDDNLNRLVRHSVSLLPLPSSMERNRWRRLTMTKNMGTIDRLARAFLIAPAATIAAFALGLGSILGIVLLVVAAIMLTTAVVSFCPLYALLGLDTRGRRPLVHG